MPVLDVPSQMSRRPLERRRQHATVVAIPVNVDVHQETVHVHPAQSHTLKRLLVPRRQLANVVETPANVAVLLELVPALLAQKPRLRRLLVPTRRLATAAEITETAHARLASVLAADARSRRSYCFSLPVFGKVVDAKMIVRLYYADFGSRLFFSYPFCT